MPASVDRVNLATEMSHSRLLPTSLDHDLFVRLVLLAQQADAGYSELELSCVKVRLAHASISKVLRERLRFVLSMGDCGPGNCLGNTDTEGYGSRRVDLYSGVCDMGMRLTQARYYGIQYCGSSRIVEFL